MKTLRLLILTIILTVPIVIFSQTELNASHQTAFYVASHGNDNNPGTKILPWKTLKPLNRHTFVPGDTIYFARGSSFRGGLLINSSGTPDKPIVFTAYGRGPAPNFTNLNPDILNGNMIQINGSYIVVNGLYFHDGIPVDAKKDLRVRGEAGAILIAPGAEHNIIKNCEIENCPIGIQVIGQYNLITHNYIHDCNIFLDFPMWGPIGIMVANSNNEISYNRITNYKAIGGAFGADGGAIEIDDQKYAKDNIYVHHNYSVGNEGFLEITKGTSTNNIQVSYNVSDDYQEFIFFWAGTNCVVENNTVLCLKPRNSRVRVVFSFANKGEVTVRNNIFVLANGLQVFGGDSVYTATEWNQPHYNNLYYVVDEAQTDPCGIPLGKGDIIADPLFIDLQNRDLHLQAGSPAVDAGIDVGQSLDFDNKPVPGGKVPDIGAFEYQNEKGLHFLKY